jgi:hypothetical protein
MNDEPKQTTISLSDFYNCLEATDWTYEMSDDHSVWRRGSAAMGKIQAEAKTSPEHQKLYDAFKAWIWAEWKTKADGSQDYEAGKVIDKPVKPMEKAFRTGEKDA